MRVGIPRSLLYYQYYPMWQTFFEELGAEVVVSPPTAGEIVASGCSRLTSEICLPVRVFCGHVISLTGKCDYLFIPSVHSVEKKVYNCPKFIGLPDLIRANVPESPPILDPDIDVNKKKRELYWSIYRLGQHFSRNPWRIRKAVASAMEVHRSYRAEMRLQKLTIPQTIARMRQSPEGQTPANLVSDVTVAAIGHPYLVHDEHVNHNLVTKLQKMGVKVVFPEMVKEADLSRSLAQIVERPYWTYEEEVVGAGGYYLQSDADGIISIVAFGCGPDSLMIELLHRRAAKLNKPFLNLVLDEHTTETGLVTRLEAFIDMIRRRKRKQIQTVSVLPPLSLESHERTKILGIQSFGSVVFALRAVAKVLGITMVAPPITKRTLSLGTRYSPESACIPFKFILGNFIEALDQGADTLLMISSVNACRLGYYGKVHEQILRDMGYDFRFFKLKSTQKGLIGVLKAVKRLANDAPWPTIIAAYQMGTTKIKALDDIERKAQQVRPLEMEKGTADNVYRQAVKAIDDAQETKLVTHILTRYMKEMDQIAINPKIIPLKVGVVGEIYAVMEPFVNMNLEVELGKLGVEVRRTKSTFFSEWVRHGAFNVLNEEKKKLKKYAQPYLRRDVGGHGFESLAEKVRLSTEGYDGIIHLAPFTCMPEAIASNIMRATTEDIPVLTILCDEQMAKAGILTRLEAFVDLIEWRRKKLNN
ncbi:MAG TPA: acyl-CoA dehydratase activase-related protein [Dehalococcoidales bacterium]|nr:acyl-CoA dehydratase activase-related protein [Dehalococcoidales bacterium]